jgi:hypothetical protein
VATAAHHGCDHFIRAKYPLRWRLRSRIRYVLEHDPRFALWRGDDGSLIGGRAGWRARAVSAALLPGDALAGIEQQNVRGLLTRAFDLAGSPLELSTIVNGAAAVWAVPLFQRDAGYPIDAIADPQPRADAALEERSRLARVWAQIRDLPLRQRHALLLNLKDDAITVFLTTGAASLRDIAGALELPVEELAALWNDLPISDNTVAARLGCTRQQVINLRMAARKRLGNRLTSRANIGAGRAL